MNTSELEQTKTQAISGSKTIISLFSFRRVLIGAVAFGLFAAIESLAQALGIVAAYPNLVDRAKIVYGLASNAALGLFYGDKHANILTGAGYMVYRILPILTLVGAIYSLMFITKMLRGQEENGRWELLLSGRSSAAMATYKTLVGTFFGLVISYLIVVVVLIAAGHSRKLAIPISGSLLYGLAVMSGAFLALGIGAIASQLAATRRRALLYGLTPIIIFFALRSIGNVVDKLAWLKNLTPFGWVDKIEPYYHSKAIWLLPLFALSLASIGLAIWLSSKRDMEESFIADSDSARPKFRLLNSQLGFNFRSTRNVLSGWLLASLAFATIIAAIDKTVAKSLSSTGGLTHAISNLSGNPESRIAVAYLSAASFIVLSIIMLIATSSLAATKEEETSSRLDNLVSGNVSRHYWLTMRLILLASSMAIVTLASNLIVWTLAEVQGVSVSFNSLIFGGFNILGPALLLLGIGVALYGLLPRIATIIMYAIIAWSFTIDIVASAVKTTKFLADSSLFHYVSLVPAANPKWTTFISLSAIGLVLIALGIWAFEKRDLISE